MPDETPAAQSPEQQEQKEPTPKPEEPKEPSPKPDEQDCSSFPPSGECDGVDDLTIAAAGDKAKADYNTAYLEPLKTARTEYETTRTAYRTARHKVRLEVEDLRNQLRHLVERIGCQIEQKRVRKCLDDAFGDVLKQLKCCRDKDPCCTKDCEFTLPTDIDKLPKLPLEQITALITQFEARITEAKDCFDKLKEEPANLEARVAEVKKAVDDINAMLTGDPATLDLKRAYAMALVAQWKIGKVWGGFDQIQDFVDCLCDALTCWSKGFHAVYILKGAEAIAKEYEAAKQEYCKKLHEQTVDQILAGYDKRCAKKYSDECSDDDDKPDDDDDHCDDDNHDDDYDDDCGCHHHHHHHHGKHHDHEDSKGKY
jgi:uncharacterized coiled-coil protein SlyX